MAISKIVKPTPILLLKKGEVTLDLQGGQTPWVIPKELTPKLVSPFSFKCHLFSSLLLGLLICYHACVLSSFSCAQLFVSLWTVAQQAPLSMGSSRLEWVAMPSSRVSSWLGLNLHLLCLLHWQASPGKPNLLYSICYKPHFQYILH